MTLVWPGSGFGLLPEDFEEPLIVHWEICDGVARSPDMPGVTIEGRPFLGIMGVAPSHARMAQITAREARLAASGFALLSPDPTLPPPPAGCPQREGFSTAPPREIGGNMDIRQLTAGSMLTLPVDVPGALFSAGDSHFAQGDGEVTGTAIEITGRCGFASRSSRGPSNTGSPVSRLSSTGSSPAHRAGAAISRRRGFPSTGKVENGYLDLTMAAKEAVREMIACLVATRGLTGAQAYVLVSVAGDLRISECVDVPNALVSVHLPLDVFDSEAHAA